MVVTFSENTAAGKTRALWDAGDGGTAAAVNTHQPSPVLQEDTSIHFSRGQYV
jgi:hypothetical protein